MGYPLEVLQLVVKFCLSLRRRNGSVKRNPDLFIKIKKWWCILPAPANAAISTSQLTHCRKLILLLWSLRVVKIESHLMWFPSAADDGIKKGKVYWHPSGGGHGRPTIKKWIQKWINLKRFCSSQKKKQNHSSREIMSQMQHFSLSKMHCKCIAELSRCWTNSTSSLSLFHFINQP